MFPRLSALEIGIDTRDRVLMPEIKAELYLATSKITVSKRLQNRSIVFCNSLYGVTWLCRFQLGKENEPAQTSVVSSICVKIKREARNKNSPRYANSTITPRQDAQQF